MYVGVLMEMWILQTSASVLHVPNWTRFIVALTLDFGLWT